jgi:hypothetical protein
MQPGRGAGTLGPDSLPGRSRFSRFHSLLSFDIPATAFLTPDIIDLQRSNRVSGQNRVPSTVTATRVDATGVSEGAGRRRPY